MTKAPQASYIEILLEQGQNSQLIYMFQRLAIHCLSVKILLISGFCTTPFEIHFRWCFYKRSQENMRILNKINLFCCFFFNSFHTHKPNMYYNFSILSNSFVVPGEDFEHMSSALLYRMLKAKTIQPLHEAVRLLREDVVFLCLVENNATVSAILLIDLNLYHGEFKSQCKRFFQIRSVLIVIYFSGVMPC